MVGNIVNLKIKQFTVLYHLSAILSYCCTPSVVSPNAEDCKTIDDEEKGVYYRFRADSLY